MVFGEIREIRFHWCSFEQGITMVFFRTPLPDARSLSKNKGLVNQGRSDVTIVSSNAPQALKPHPWVRQIGAKSASSPPRPKSAPRGSKSTTFARGIIQSFHLPNFLHNPIGDPSVLPIQYPIYLWLQAAAWEVFGIGGWCVLSCMSIQILKLTVQA